MFDASSTALYIQWGQPCRRTPSTPNAITAASTIVIRHGVRSASVRRTQSGPLKQLRPPHVPENPAESLKSRLTERRGASFSPGRVVRARWSVCTRHIYYAREQSPIKRRFSTLNDCAVHLFLLAQTFVSATNLLRTCFPHN